MMHKRAESEAGNLNRCWFAGLVAAIAAYANTFEGSFFFDVGKWIVNVKTTRAILETRWQTRCEHTTVGLDLGVVATWWTADYNPKVLLYAQQHSLKTDRLCVPSLNSSSKINTPRAKSGQ